MPAPAAARCDYVATSETSLSGGSISRTTARVALTVRVLCPPALVNVLATAYRAISTFQFRPPDRRPGSILAMRMLGDFVQRLRTCGQRP